MTPETMGYVAALARAVDLLRRSQEPGEPQKAALRALVALAAERSATLRWYEGTLTLDGVVIPTSDVRLAAFAERLIAQDVAEIVIARGAEPGELVALVRGLAAEPGHGRIKEKLRDAASTRVMVVNRGAHDPHHRAASVTGAFAKVKQDESTMAEWNKFLDHGGQSRTDHQVDIGLKAPTGEIVIDINATTGQAPAVAPRASVLQSPPDAPPPPPKLPQPPTLFGAATPLGTGLLRVVTDPYGKDALARITQLARLIQDAFTQDRQAEAIDAVNTLIELESKAPEAGVKNSYSVMLGRILTGTALAKVAPYLTEPKRKERATRVLKRGGEASTILLIDLISRAQTLGERMAYAEVLREIQNGTDRLVGQLSSRSEWQTVRNIAELAGEARMGAAVPYLARLAEQGSDDRVRRAALIAMAKIGSAATVEPLRSAFRAGAPELRALLASNIGGAHARPLTAPLATLADEEENADVVREYLRALGRIATPEALDVLKRFAGQRVVLSRRARAAKDAAQEVLRSLPPA